ncbi:MAG: Fe-S protein assembly co-chaperone HscB, partial [Pseudomonadota bacterium]|nr:Fe-S protein assembly co-chaperone HscB [Pseudomonadota bacterium]
MRNYFDAFGLPTQFMLDQNELKQKYLALQNILHPDRYAHASEREKLLALQKSTELNDAFNTLK